MMAVYNEEDIIGEVIEHLISQEIELVVLDNGSTDNSYQICKNFADKDLIRFKQFTTETFASALILRILYDMALARDPDWLVMSGADELLESGMQNVNLKGAIAKEDADGYNLIQFDCFEFFLTNNDNESAKLIKEKLQYYSWQHDHVYRAWKHFPGTRVEDTGSHLPIFPDGQRYMLSPRKFILRHYRFRSREQADRKMKERLTRLNDTERKIGWHAHYDKIQEHDIPVIADPQLLNKYHEDNKWYYEKMFNPYSIGHYPTRNDMFSKDGHLKVHYPTLNELKVQANILRQSVINIKKDPMGKLLSLYYSREDLQKAFPEVMNGQYSSLLKWAAKYGTTIDTAKDELMVYKDWYQASVTKIQ